ncbi:MAG TPA: enoyl-CoA hydratase-related protein [Thermohalobaculum sp.]|nr:enoyl-CoA hydratase-related protein [Thermohalobaculum sp.]
MDDIGTVELALEEVQGGRVAWLALSNPRKVNALSPGVVAALKAQAEALAGDAALRAVVLGGAGGRAFAAGADLEVLAGLDAESGRAFITALHEAIEALRRIPVPVVAMLRGPCLGGAMELAAAADIRVADASLTLGMPEVRVGIPSVIEACLLPRLVGWGKAAEIVLTGDTLDAGEALRCGFVQRLVAPDALEAETRKVVGSILAAGPGAVRAQKRIMRGWETLPEADAIALSIDEFAAMFPTGEPAAYMRPFLERRKGKA